MTKTVEIKDKWLLTVEEAAAYFGIGSKKIRAMAADGVDEGWALMNGSKV